MRGFALACLIGSAVAVGAEPNLLPPEQAFRFSARALDARTLEAQFAIADGYYLYRDKLRFSTAPGSVVAAAALPKGRVKDDPFFGQVETYRHELIIRLPLSERPSGGTVTLEAESQGCADAGVCYPPVRQTVRLPLPAAGAGPGPYVDANPAKKSWFK